MSYNEQDFWSSSVPILISPWTLCQINSSFGCDKMRINWVSAYGFIRQRIYIRKLAVIACCCSAPLSTIAVAQNENQVEQNVRSAEQGNSVSASGLNSSPIFGGNQNMVTEFSGTLQGFQRGVVYVQKPDGTDVMVQIPETITSFRFIAQAKPAFLQRGQLVRLRGTFNPVNAMPVTPINKVELFQPVAAAITGRMREQFIPGIYQEQPGENPQAFGQPVSCRIVGAVMGLNQNGVLMLQTGVRPLQIPLAPEATFEICYNNLSLAQEGDQVSVSGFYQPPDETRIRAERITITTERVYGEYSEQAAQRVTRRRRNRVNDPEKLPDQEGEEGLGIKEDIGENFEKENEVTQEKEGGAGNGRAEPS